MIVGLMVGEISSSAPRDPRLYRRVFVGRELELDRLLSAYELALGGAGGLVMLAGEPGIGKTALCEQLAWRAAENGGAVSTGHCYEEGSLTRPYLPFIEAIRLYAGAKGIEDLRAELGSGLADVARIVTDIQQRLDVELPPPGDPGDDRWRLLESVTSFLARASAVQPLVIILEDLHWADRGTLDLLLHVARNLPGSRLLIVGTYRDVEVDRTHPLSGTLAELRRGTDFPRVSLRGLTVDEVHRMYSELRGVEVSMAQAEAVYLRTEGNPLFVQEVVRYVIEEGRRSQGAEATGLPEGLRDVVGKRLSRLSENCNRLLAIAAVIGREFDFDTLGKIAGLEEGELVSRIEEAVKVGVLEERSSPGSVLYRFAHAFFRESLYGEMIAPRRLRLHQQVARALEARYSGRLEEHAAELAEHYGQSTDLIDLAKAVQYWELSSRRAMSVFAYAQAEHDLRRCLEVQEVLDPADKTRRCDLLLALGESMLPQEQPNRVPETVADEAFALAEAEGSPERATRAALQSIEAFLRGAAWTQTPEFGVWVERADRYAQPGTPERVYADMGLSMHLNVAVNPATGHEFNRRAIERAAELEEPAPFFLAAGYGLMGMTSLRDRDRMNQVVADVMRRPRDGIRSNDLGLCLVGAATVLLSRGDRAGAEAAFAEVAQAAQRTNDATMANQAMIGPIMIALIEGRLDEAVDLYAVRRAHSLENNVTGVSNGRALGRPPLMLGRAADFLDEFDNPGRSIQAARALFLAHLGRLHEARDILAKFPNVVDADDESGTHVIVNLLETAILCGDKQMTRGLMRRLEPIADESYFGNDGMGVTFGRLLGDGSVLLGEPSDALDYYGRALGFCDKIGFRPEAAQVRLAIAEVLLAHRPGERETAMAHLDFAIAECEAMGMEPALARALTLRGRRRVRVAQERPVYPDGLSEREVEVLLLIAQGKSNQQIAADLVISMNTVAHHVGHIFDKTGAANRAEAASYAHRQGLV